MAAYFLIALNPDLAFSIDLLDVAGDLFSTGLCLDSTNDTIYGSVPDALAVHGALAPLLAAGLVVEYRCTVWTNKNYPI